MLDYRVMAIEGRGVSDIFGILFQTAVYHQNLLLYFDVDKIYYLMYVSPLCIQELYRGSGELLKHMVGIIQPKLVSSDGVFYKYENFVDSLWTIIGKETSSILLKVMMMDIEFHHACSYDALNVSTLFINTYSATS